MTQVWQYYRVPFKFMLSDKTLFAPSVWLQVREIGLAEDAPPAPVPMPPDDPLLPKSEGFLIRSMRITGEQPRTRDAGPGGAAGSHPDIVAARAAGPLTPTG